MKIRLLGEGDEEGLIDLQSWLTRDPGTARVTVDAVPGTGPTMGVLESLDVVLGNAVEIANFALAYVTWRSVHRDEQEGSGSRISDGQTLVHGDTTVEIGHLSAEELADLLRRLDAGTAGADE
ncbi:hypothetical protein ACIP2X_15430 [Streptomyces sp. NPDC089424]|uniref:effector-associated constant component EACC1 n=1 Tax=Streptomyces sp. NPDC089424 TaxID=3365917 RepID=UPI00380DA988